MSIKNEVLSSYDEKVAVKLLKNMIEIPSVTGEETELAKYTGDFMKERGFHEVHIQEVVKDKYQTIGLVRGNGSGKSIMLCGHLDIFPPPAGMKNPYKAFIENGRIHGAGVADMKAGTASTIMAADAIIQSDVEIQGDIIVALVMEEEIGGVGINYLLEKGVTADLGIVPESTNLEISTTGAGISQYMVTTHGKSVHVSNKEHGIDAVAQMTKAIEAINNITFTHQHDPRVPLLPRHVASTIIGGRGTNYDLRGAQNLSDYCSLIVDVRFWKTMNTNTIKNDLKQTLDEVSKQDPEFKYSLSEVPIPFGNRAVNRNPKDLPRDSQIVNIVQENHMYVTGEQARLKDVSQTAGNDDGVHMIEAGIPTVTYGPGPGQVRPEEYNRFPLQTRWIDLTTYHTCGKVMTVSAIDVITQKRECARA
jgi:acetylornithine deacetylase